ncbi:MAG: hypothetical protein F6K10_37440, partial [Moorea sp. SIO2B7]|nr:hypothetical protein [Moorena sp. SIO2B7]
IAISAIAISPLHVLYAQEARQYSLWTVTILLSSWAMLRAMRVNTKKSWGVYAVTLALGLYTHLISVMVAIAHGIYVISKESFRFTKTVIAYIFASLTGFLLFLPWMIIYLAHSKDRIDKSPGWSKTATPLTSLVQTWILNLSRVFFDFNDSFSYRNSLGYILIIIIVVYSVYFICRHTPKRVWLFIGILIGVPALLLAMPDLILGGRRSTPIRYFIPSYLSIQIAIAYLIYVKISPSMSLKIWEQKLWQFTTIALISSVIISCVFIFHADTWWNKYREYYHSEVAKIINQANNPLVIAPWFDMRSLSHSLASHVELQDIRLRKEINSVGKGFSDVFFYKNKGPLKYFLDTHPNYRIENTYNWKRQTTPVTTTKTTLWQIVKDESI